MSTESLYLKKMQEKAVQGVVDDLVDEKEEGWKNRTARDSYTAKLHCLELMGIKIKRDALYKRVERQSKKRKLASAEPIEEAPPINEIETHKNDNDVSSVSCPSFESNTNETANEITDPSQGGRPKGSTLQKKREDMKNYTDCMNAITMVYNNEPTQCRAQGKTVTRGFLKEVIEQKKGEFSTKSHISESTVWSRISRQSLTPTHRGTSSPLQNAEMALVAICIQMGKIRQPITCEEAIAIMNDLISETEMAESLTQFQKARTSTSSSYGSVGKNWWMGFKKPVS